MTAIEQLIALISESEMKEFSKEKIIDLLQTALPMEKLNIEIAEMRGEIRLLKSQNKTK